MIAPTVTDGWRKDFYLFLISDVIVSAEPGAMEFQAIVLADHDDGSGTRLYPLLEKTPKSLLPIAGRPLIAYQLALLERSGFKEVGGLRCAAPAMRSRRACPDLTTLAGHCGHNRQGARAAAQLCRGARRQGDSRAAASARRHAACATGSMSVEGGRRWRGKRCGDVCDLRTRPCNLISH